MVSTAPRSSYFPKSLNCRNCLRCSTLRVPSLEADTRVCVLSGENDRSRTTSLWSMRITWRRPVQEKQYTLVHGAKIRTNTFLSFFCMARSRYIFCSVHTTCFPHSFGCCLQWIWRDHNCAERLQRASTRSQPLTNVTYFSSANIILCFYMSWCIHVSDILC